MRVRGPVGPVMRGTAFATFMTSVRDESRRGRCPDAHGGRLCGKQCDADDGGSERRDDDCLPAVPEGGQRPGGVAAVAEDGDQHGDADGEADLAEYVDDRRPGREALAGATRWPWRRAF